MLESGQRTLHPVVMLILVLITMGISFVLIGPIIGFLIALPFYDGDLLEFAETIQDPLNHPEIRTPLFIIQGFATFIGLIVAPLLLCVVVKYPVRSLLTTPLYSIPVILTPIVIIVFMGVNSFFIEWNATVNFPESLKTLGEWAREREDYAAELTKMLIQMDTPVDLIISLMVIAFLPAVGEEFVFRGLIQNELSRATKNIHVSIWIAAVLFSAIHMQFFGFLPRLFLGVLFGYLYVWSGNLVIPVLAHFTNNAFAVIGFYFYQKGSLEYNVEDTEAFPSSVILTSALISAALLYYFWKFHKDKPSSIQS